WAEISKHLPGRDAKQCRERYINHLDPSLRKAPWTPEEEAALVAHCRETNCHWAEVWRRFPGRSYNDVKNRYYLLERRA
ncbi:Homeodomain-like protein, partial [Tribonema minus]